MTNLPVVGVFTVTATYGQKGKYWATYHKGIDIVCTDHRIFATCDGTVRVVAYDANGWGQYVSVGDSEGRRHIFCHLVKGSVRVKVGDKVTRSTVLGTMGATGNVSGVHLHYQINDKNNTPIEPCPYLGIPNKVGTYDSKDYEIKEDSIMYKDEENISNFAKDAVRRATDLGFLKGYPDGKFHPKANISREELAVVIMRVYDKLKK